MDYKARPTTYAGVNFRSRLEARWAAFFDLAGWRWEYEPVDLVGWSPDFLLFDIVGRRMWVEVKPIDIATQGVFRDELEKAWRASETAEDDDHVIALGLGPYYIENETILGVLLRRSVEYWDIEELPIEGMTPAAGKLSWNKAGAKSQWRGR